MKVCLRICFAIRKRDCLDIFRVGSSGRILYRRDYGLALKRRCSLMKISKTFRLDSNGNLVNFGNCDANGANVNNNPDNSNDNLGVCLSRSLAPLILAGFCFNVFNPTAQHAADLLY